MSTERPLRLWPGVAAAALLVLVGYVVPILVPEYAGYGMMGAALLGPKIRVGNAGHDFL